MLQSIPLVTDLVNSRVSMRLDSQEVATLARCASRDDEGGFTSNCDGLSFFQPLTHSSFRTDCAAR